MTVMILVVALEVVLVLSAWDFGFNGFNNKFKGFVSPSVLGLLHYLWLGLVSAAVSDRATFEFLCTKPKFFEVFPHFCIGNPPVEVFVHLAHQFKNLLLSYCEPHALEHVVELVDFDVVIFVVVDLIENLL